jgi:hypothetical protein
MRTFNLRWRFTDRRYCRLSDAALAQVRPLAQHSAWHVAIAAAPLLRRLDGTMVRVGRARLDRDRRSVLAWLGSLPVSADERVMLSWSRLEGATTCWGMFVRHWDAFWYPSSDDLFVFPARCDWGLFLDHEEHARFRRWRG